MLQRLLAAVLPILATVFTQGAVTSSMADDRPNVVWIIADDLSPDLGCYGYEGVRTPNIDLLAQQGARYTAAFATSPVCSPSRSALITGVYQTTTGSHQHRTGNKRPLPESIEPVTESMRRAGYFVCNSNWTMKRPGKTDYNFEVDRAMYDAADWAGRNPNQPFFAQVQIKEPHRDFVVAKDRDRTRQVYIPPYYPEHPIVRADWANYLASIEVLDRKVGDVLDRLQREGLADSTLVFFFGDHGRPHYRDKQWLYDGGIRVPFIVRWPNHLPSGAVRHELVSLIDVTAATLGAAGVEIPPWMQGRDLLDAGFAGRELIFAARDRCGDTPDRIRSVRSQRFKYIRNYHPERPYTQHSGYKELQYPGMTVARVLMRGGELTGAPARFWSDSRPAEELYDVVADPEELINLADDPAHGQTLSGLRDALERWIERTDDRGRFDEIDVQATLDSSRSWFRGRMQKRGLSPQINPNAYLEWWERELGVK
jgi:N-sulfoglucosamine sulfohydrolase